MASSGFNGLQKAYLRTTLTFSTEPINKKNLYTSKLYISKMFKVKKRYAFIIILTVLFLLVSFTVSGAETLFFNWSIPDGGICSTDPKGTAKSGVINYTSALPVSCCSGRVGLPVIVEFCNSIYGCASTVVCCDLCCPRCQSCSLSGACVDICKGTDTSCGCDSVPCRNCDLRDGCVGKDYVDYSCTLHSCTYTITVNDPRCCTPESCDSLEKQCGNWSDGCGGALNCGSCPANRRCSYSPSYDLWRCRPLSPCTPNCGNCSTENPDTWTTWYDSDGLCNSGRDNCRIDYPNDTRCACSDECSPGGSRQCFNSSAYRVCGDYDADSCLEWGAPLSCPAGQACSGGVCSACSDECSPGGSRQCFNSSAYQVCDDHNCDSCLEWGAPLSCPAGQVCVDGHCSGECKITSVSVTPNCAGVASSDCDAGDSISLSASYTGDCSLVRLLQVDASGGGCTIAYSGASVMGMQGRFTTFPSVSPAVATWTITSVPETCADKTMTPTAAGFYSGEPLEGNFIDSTTSVSGSFKFGPAGCINECNSGDRKCYDTTSYQLCTLISSCYAWGSPVSCPAGQVCSNGQCVGGEVCSAAGDEDGNGECDYDSSTCSHGDVVCPVGVTGLTVSNSNPYVGSTIAVDCTSTVGGVNSVSASVDGVGLCQWLSWSNNVASFSCGVGSVAGPRTVRCYVDTFKSYAVSGQESRTMTINVTSSECDKHNSSSSCEADTKCDWCPQCVGVKYTGGVVDRCLVAGTCPSPYCWSGFCGASCDPTQRGCVSPFICNDATCTCGGCVSCSSDTCYNSTAVQLCSSGCLGLVLNCNPGAVCGEDARCVCPDGTQLCADGSCKTNCDNVTCNNNGVCDTGEGCSCPDCEGERDGCDVSSVCIDDICKKCELSSARWDVSCGCDACPVSTSSPVGLIAVGNDACVGQSFRFRVFWKGDYTKVVNPSPPSSDFGDGRVVSNWTPFWADANSLPLITQDPVYEFYVDAVGVDEEFSVNKIMVCLVDGEADDDCDGVKNTEDQCPNSLCGVTVIKEDGVCKGCTEDQCDCVSQVDCSMVPWSECNEKNKKTRNICKNPMTGQPFFDETGSCCNQQSTCMCNLGSCTNHGNWIPTVRDCLVEEEFSFFSAVNVLVVLSFLLCYYLFVQFRKKKK